MSTLAPTWDSLRMTRDYTETYYLPGLAKVQQLRAGGAKAARDRAAGIARLRAEWSSLGFLSLTESERKGVRRVTVDIELGRLEPSDIRVQLFAAPEASPAIIVDAVLIDRVGSRATYEGRLAEGPSVEVVARIIPSSLHTDGEALPGLIAWSA